jgi:hypothetical protein
MKWLGHSSMQVTQIYAHFAPAYDPEIEKLTIVLPKSPYPDSKVTFLPQTDQALA